MAHDARLDELLAEWEQQRLDGVSVPLEQLCPGPPDLVQELGRRIQALEHLEMEFGAGAEPGMEGESTEPVPPATAETESEREYTTVARYRSHSVHAEGGLGRVYAAQDMLLGREVVLKVMKASGRDEAGKQRFLHEAQVTGRLEHPSIAPVYSTGEDEHGRPFYAMRLISGRTLQEGIRLLHFGNGAGRPVPLTGRAFRELLTSFVTVCKTVAFAHQRQTVHLDLKPANIIQGAFGETVVVDWGLACSLGDTPPGPSGGPLPGTPSYMSPEQALGQADRVGPHSDVYSLGAILYDLLTGQPPYRGKSSGEVISRVRSGEAPPRPKAVNRAIPRALEAVCLKALDREPGQRYATPLELADDLERWLADEPVSAWREPWATRARRWVTRHRTVVTGAAVAVLVAVVSLGVATALLARANQREQAARRQAEDNAAEARRQRDRARANLDRAKLVVDECFGIAKDHPLLQREDLREVRRLLHSAALKHYLGLADQQPTDPAMRAEVARTYMKIGYITWEIGSKAEGLAAYARARNRLQALVDERGDAGLCWELAVAHNQVGIHQAALGRAEEALRSFRQAQAIREGLIGVHPREDRLRSDLAGTYNNMGLSSQALGRRAEALTFYGLGKQALNQLAADHPGEAEYRHELGNVCDQLGGLLHEMGQTAESLAAHEQALKLQEELAERHPNASHYRAAIATCLHNLSLRYQMLGDPEKAAEARQRGHALREELARQHPNVTRFRALLANSHYEEARRLSAIGRQENALASLKTALDLQEKLVLDHPDVPEYRHLHGNYLDFQATVLEKSGRRKEVPPYRDRALNIRKKLVEDFPRHPGYRQNLASSYFYLGRESEEAENPKKALEYYEEARKVQEGLCDARHSDADRQLARSLIHIGLVQVAMGKKKDAFESLDRARKILEDEAKQRPSSVDLKSDLAACYANLVRVVPNEKPAEGVKYLEKACEAQQQLLDGDPGNTHYRLSLAVTLHNLGALSEGPKGIPFFQKAVYHQRTVYERDPKPPLHRVNLIIFFGKLALGYGRTGQFADATKTIQNLFKLLPKDPEALYQGARILSRCVPLVAKDKANPTPAELTQREQLAAEAMKALGRALDNGFKDQKRLRTDEDLEPLRSRPGFKDLLGRLGSMD